MSGLGQRQRPIKQSKQLASASVCSPSRDGLKHSCLTDSELRTIAAMYNKETPLNKIPLAQFKSRRRLIASLTNIFSEKCEGKGDHCWLQDPLIQSSSSLYTQLKDNYRPKMPSSWEKNKREWLNTGDIISVMKQYVNKYPAFEFLGVFPVNFVKKDNTSSCIIREMCNFDINDLRSRGKSEFGLVCNLDRHDEPGSHWVSMFCSLDPTSTKYGICYYDSNGQEPPADIAAFLKTVALQVDDNSHFKVKYNPSRHQFAGTECGIFSMLLIILCLQNNKSSHRQIREMIHKLSDKSDNGIHAFRKKFYQSV